MLEAVAGVLITEVQPPVVEVLAEVVTEVLVLRGHRALQIPAGVVVEVQILQEQRQLRVAQAAQAS